MSSKSPYQIPGAVRVRHHAERQRQAGLTRLTVWVPKTRAAEVRDLAARLRQEEGVPLPSEGASRSAPAGVVRAGERTVITEVPPWLLEEDDDE